MTDDSIRESMIKRFHTIPGVGMSKAELIFDAGYTTISSLQKADVDALAQVRGISSAMARFIIREVKTMSDEKSSEMVSCSTQLTATSKPDDGDSATIKVGETVQGTTSMGKPEDDIKTDAGAASATPAVDATQPSGGGFFSGLVNSFKSMFGGGSKSPEPAPAEAKPEVKDSEPGPATVTIKEDTSKAKPDAEKKPDEKLSAPATGTKPEPKVEAKPDDTEPKEPADAKIKIIDGEKPKTPAKPASDEKKPKGRNDGIVDDIIKELDLDKEHR